MLSLLLSFLLFFLRTGQDSVFVTKSKSADIALLGNNVTLNCNLTIPADVLQITWQKLQGSVPENIGTYSSQHGEKILPPYNERIQCSSTELTSSSMTIYNVTLKDDACYKCLFNVFPNGIYGGKMCFSVQNVPELRSELHPHPTIEGILIVICSATGKPAPHITFSHERLLMGLPKEYTDQSPDGITNVTKWYNISKEAVRSLKIENASCVMDHPLRKKKELVYFSQEPESISNDSLSRSHIYLIAALICPLLLISCLVIYTKRIKNKNSHCSAQNISFEKPEKEKPMESDTQE
ncbi:OX-2 membrane glycoprotein-like isoform X3 [Antechinus flavipes]|uniref:OX-2 membrane glycoprotein-like isoform X3 n=1 Tax=Antechinus flavipes TaxID=38775 RepID=UPI0022369CDF|nr:OX-2 membrane glycoprotein-like isoform X3 [Antechinus flavipes]